MNKIKNILFAISILMSYNIMAQNLIEDSKQPFHHLYIVNVGQSYGLIDSRGHYVVKLEYDAIEQIDANMYLFYNNYNLGDEDGDIYDTNGKFISSIEKEEDIYQLFRSEGEIDLRLYKGNVDFDSDTNGYYYLADDKGNILAKQLSNYQPFNKNGICIADTGILICDYNGVDREYQSHSGLMDATGRWIVQPKYKVLEETSNGYYIASISLNEPCVVNESDCSQAKGYDRCELRKGLIDSQGKTLIKPQYLELLESYNGLFIATTNKDVFFIDCNGNEVFGKHFKWISSHRSRYIEIEELDGKCAVVDLEQKCLKVFDLPVSTSTPTSETTSHLLWAKDGFFCIETTTFNYADEDNDPTYDVTKKIINLQGKVIWESKK